MTLAPFLDLSPLFQLHVITALAALVIGPFAILRRRRDRLHKVMGYVWVLAMLTTATAALFMPSFGFRWLGHLGPIHLFSALTYWSLYEAMRGIWRRDIRAHEAAMKGLYWRGLCLAGLFQFIPGRTTSRAIFPETPELGWAVIAAGCLAIAWLTVQNARAARQGGPRTVSRPA